MRSFKEDKDFGDKKEDEVIVKVRNHFTEEVGIEKTDNYCVYDYESRSGNTWEVKSRRVKKDKYDTTIIPVSKVRNTSKRQFFVFNFLDTCSYIEYDKEVFKEFTIAPVRVYRAGINDKPRDHFFIPIDMLEDLCITNIYPKEIIDDTDT